MGLCYTQLYDVEQEENGLMTYDRRFKFSPDIFYKINTRKAKNKTKKRTPKRKFRGFDFAQ